MKSISKYEQIHKFSKNKGRNLEKSTIKKLKKQKFNVKTTINSGAVFDDADFKLEDFMIEEKNTKQLNIKHWFNKLKEQVLKIFPHPKPALKFRIDNNEYIIIEYDVFLSILKRSK